MLPSGGTQVNGSTWLARVAVVAEDDVAMQVVALAERGPLVADEGGEAARLVVVLGGGDGLLPRAAIGARAGGILQRLRETCPAKSCR